MLVEVTTVEQLVDKLKKGKFRDHEDIVAQSNAFSQRSSHLLKDAFYSDKNLKWGWRYRCWITEDVFKMPSMQTSTLSLLSLMVYLNGVAKLHASEDAV
jgi:hypothetical protein